MRSATSTLGVKKYIFSLFIVLLLSSCGSKSISEEPKTDNTPVSTNQETINTQEPEKIYVSTSIVPLSSVVNTIGGDYVEVENIVPVGVSPHGFDLSAQQMARISESEKVFMIGLEHIDGFLDKAVSEEKQVHLADGMELIEVEGHHHDDHEDEHHDEHSDEEKHHDDHEDEHHDEHDHSSDPHVWLGKDNIIEIAQKVRDELASILPTEAEYFNQNTEKFISDLEALYDNFEEETNGKTPREFIVFHDAYNYLMQSINMDLNLKVPFSENVLHDTGTAHMAELIQEVELHGIKNIFSEPQFSSGNIEKFAKEYNLTLGIIDPQGTNPEAGGYLENIKNNLDSLAKVYE